MKKVELKPMEENKYEIIKNLVDNKSFSIASKTRAACKLKLSIRQVNRLIQKYINEGKEGFVHKNRGKKPARTIPDETKQKIVELFKTKYEGANIEHFKELLERNESIKISYAPLYNILRSSSLLSPKVHKKTVKFEKKRIQALQKAKQKLSEADKDLIVKNNILDSYDAHSRVPRCKYYGECLEMDACKDYWLGEEFGKITLHGAIDNATGQICGLFFDKEETLNGYYNLFDIILRNCGIPAKFKTDNRTVFIYNGLKQKSLEKDTLTQFGYACHTLGVDLETTSVPEQKSRIERLWGTLLNRLILEMKLAGIKSIEGANEFVRKYTTTFNKQFALQIDYTTSVFEKIEKSEENNVINTSLAIISTRVFDKGCSIKINNKIYLAYKGDKQMNYVTRTKCLVIKTFDGRLLCNVDDELSELRELDQTQNYSKNFDQEPKEEKQRRKHIPPMTHPWKMASFNAYLMKSKRTEEYANI